MTRKLTAEFIGVFTLTFIGVAAIVGDGGLLVVALAHGLAIAVMVSAFAATSGGHLNPGITLGMLLTGKVDVGTAFGYWIAQCAGSIVAAFLAVYACGEQAVHRAAHGVPALALNIEPSQGFVLELIATFLLGLVVFGTAVDRRAHKVGGLFIGLTIVMGILAIGPFTGAAINPARWLGSAVAGGGYANAWVYIVGPLLGGALGCLVYKSAIGEPEADEVPSVA